MVHETFCYITRQEIISLNRINRIMRQQWIISDGINRLILGYSAEATF